MAPYKVREGLEVEFDFNAVTTSEWRKLFKGELTTDEEDAAISKITGVDASSLGNLSIKEYKRLILAIAKASNEMDPS
jgi:hypothetical protein